MVHAMPLIDQASFNTALHPVLMLKPDEKLVGLMISGAWKELLGGGVHMYVSRPMVVCACPFG